MNKIFTTLDNMIKCKETCAFNASSDAEALPYYQAAGILTSFRSSLGEDITYDKAIELADDLLFDLRIRIIKEQAINERHRQYLQEQFNTMKLVISRLTNEHKGE